MSERILIRDRIITKIDAVKMEKGHFRMETTWNQLELKHFPFLSGQACKESLHCQLQAPWEQYVPDVFQ